MTLADVEDRLIAETRAALTVDHKDVGGRATPGAVADDHKDVGGRATAVADDHKDVGGRATPGAVAEEARAEDGQRRCRQVDTLPGELNLALLKTLLTRCPGAYWAFLGGRAEPSDGFVRLLSTWGLYLLTNHASGHAAQRRGDTRTIGAYEMVSLLAPHFHQFVVPGHGMMTFQRVQNLFSAGLQSQGFSLWALSFELPMCLSEDGGQTTEDGLAGFVSFPDAVSLGLVPEVGIGHEDDYEPLAGVTDG